ncbi:metallophosphoesterase family protein [Vulgatibacter incomptus]|uniref:DNA double-strand break repair protein Mre11 n=1 Tax=Vulgatibacter incomptus TaxID=1391653 RepID=A0A0K1PEU2_9BACT|nr:DNA repair exonuclease [Vulgatibacter incomptus]AKU92022.1 DNA double-strand break repair protein Mre11 [Vulgatibacter incomptus]
MSTFTFLHAADLHLDTPFEGLGAQRPELAEALREASLRAFERLIDLALERRVAFVVLAGDLYDGAERGVRAQLAFRRGLERLSRAGIAALIAHGNHDPVDEGWGAIASWPSLVHVFGSKAVESVPIVHEGNRIATVHGISFGTRSERENLAARFRRGPEAGLHVGVLHCNVDGQPGHDPYAPCSTADLTAAGLDYWALGHVHAGRVLLRGRTWAAYSGNLQGRSFKPAEQGAKGALLIHVVDDAVAEVEPCPLAPVRFSTVTADIDGLEDLPALERLLLDEAQGLSETPGCEGLMLAAKVVGRGPLHRSLVGREEALRSALEDATQGRRPWIRWERLERRTSPEVEREVLVQRADLVGGILRRLDAIAADLEAGSGAVGRAMIESLELPLRGGALRNHVPPIADDEIAALLESVERDALDRLEVEA